MNLDFDPQKNYYDILWIEEWAWEDEIKKAYRKLAMKYHPDRNRDDKSAEDMFKEVNEANEVLSDNQKRQQYDAYRKGWFGAGWFWWGWGFGWAWWFGWWVDLWDLLWWFFWWWSGSRGWPQQWDDLMLQITISFEESYHWFKKDVSYSRAVREDWLDEKTCQTCNGAWAVSQQVRTPFGVMQTQAACPTCQWVWVEYYKNWTKQPWGGVTSQTEKLEVNIPAWIKSWSKIRYPWKGSAWAFWGPEGDLYIKILVKSSDTWKREWDNILVEQSISLFDAVLWWEVVIEHPDKAVKVKIPKWLQIGEQIRVSWKWFGDKWLLKSKGDLIVLPKISIPQRLSKDEEKLWKELAGK